MSDHVFEFPNLKPPKLSMRMILIGVAVLAALFIVFGSFYQVQPEEVGLVLRFGEHVRTTDPGLNLKMPFAEKVLKVPVQRQLKQEFGFSTVQVPGTIQAGQSVPGRITDADWRSQRCGRGVDCPVPNRGPLSLLVQGASPRRCL